MIAQATIAAVLQKRRKQLQAQWSKELDAAGTASAKGRMSAEELNRHAGQFLDLLTSAVQSGHLDNITGVDWTEVRTFLEDFSRQRVRAGYSSDETAKVIFSLKGPVFRALQEELSGNTEKLTGEIWVASALLDQLGLHTISTFQKAREEVISRQQLELLELSTPVVKLWDGILALPMIGTLDSARTQVVMESLLQKIVETGSQIAIIDITGVPTVDTLVAQHLLKTVTALRLMGADCIISGVRPQIAQTIVHLGLDLQGVTTKANLADALALALKRLGITFGR